MIGLVVAVMTTTMMMMLATLSPASGQGSPLLSPMPPAAAGAGSPGRRLRRARGSAWHTAMQLHCSFSDTTTRSCRRAGGPRPPGATGAARGLAGGRAGGNRTWRPSSGFQDVGRVRRARGCAREVRVPAVRCPVNQMATGNNHNAKRSKMSRQRLGHCCTVRVHQQC